MRKHHVCKPDGMRETPLRQKAADRMNCNVLLLLATAALLAGSVGVAQAALPERGACASPESAGRHFRAAAPTGINVRLASQLPRISAPQIHVSTAHVTTGNIHPAIGVNSGAVKIRGANSRSLKITSAHQFDKNNGGKGKGGNTKGGSGGSFLLKLDGIDGESMDTKGRPPEIQ